MVKTVEGEMHRSSRLALRAALLGLLLVPSGYVAWQSRDMPQLGHLQDDGIYWVTAQSLATGHGYRILSLPYRPWQTKYPPVYPAMLALIWRAQPHFPENLPYAALFSWLTLPLLLILARVFYQRLGLGEAHAWLLCGLLALNVHVVHFSISLMPELLFTSVLIGSILLADESRHTWTAALSGCAAGAAYLIKAAALPLLLAGPALFLFRKDRQRALLFVAGMAPSVLGWQWWVHQHLSPAVDDVAAFYTDYTGYRLYNVSWPDLPQLVWRNLNVLLTGLGELLAMPDFGSALGHLFPCLVALIAFYGVVALARRTQKLSLYYIFGLAMLPLLLIWHYPPGPRFSLPLLPLLLAGFTSAIRSLMRKAGEWLSSAAFPKRLAAASACVGVMAMVGVGLLSTYGFPLRLLTGLVSRDREELASRREAYAWVGQNVPPSSGLVTSEDAMAYLYTFQPASSFPTPPKLMYHDDLSGLANRYHSITEFAARNHLHYLLLAQSDFLLETDPDLARRLMEQMLADHSIFELVHQAGEVSIYRIRQDEPAS